MVTFKPLTQSEIDIVVTMMADFYAIDQYSIDIEVSKRLFDTFIDDENLGRAFLICANNEIVGYIILTFVFSFEYQGKIAVLDELYLKKAMRGKGIGKQAIHFSKALAKQLKLKLIYLEVENHNENAQKLYFANDFEVHHRKILKYKIT
jgi:ribosomal protein S18 acetylase RimI-like enzyme